MKLTIETKNTICELTDGFVFMLFLNIFALGFLTCYFALIFQTSIGG